MPALTRKYFVRLRAAIMLESRGYRQARKRYGEHLKDFSADELLVVEKTFREFGTLHARGVARYIRELMAERMKVSA